MPFDAMSGDEPRMPSCCACRQPIWRGQPAIHVHFNHDPVGAKGLTGDYHQQCSRPFQSMARVVNLNPWGRF
jgi:hypothetical protein